MKQESLNPEGRPPMYDKAKIRVNLTLTEDSIGGGWIRSLFSRVVPLRASGENRTRHHPVMF